MNINKYPYTDFHELNLDWFLAQFKTLTDAWDSQQADYNKFKEDVTTEFNNLSGKFDTLEETVHSFTTFITNYFNNLDVQQEINNKLDEMVSDGTMTELIRPIFDAYAAQMTQRMNVLEGRMDTFASLPDGSTAGDAELLDIRVGGNGVTYSSAGNAVRAQYDINHAAINDLKESFDLYDKGKVLIPGNWAQGRLNATTGLYTSSGNYRIATTDKVIVDRDYTFSVETGFEIYFFIFDAEGEIIKKSGWVTSYDIANGTQYTATIKKVNEDAAIPANVFEFRSAVTDNSNTEEKIIALDNRLEIAENGIIATNINLNNAKDELNEAITNLALFDKIFITDGNIINGNISSAGNPSTEAAYIYRVFTSEMLQYPTEVTLTFETGYNGIVFFYSSSVISSENYMSQFPIENGGNVVIPAGQYFAFRMNRYNAIATEPFTPQDAYGHVYIQLESETLPIEWSNYLNSKIPEIQTAITNIGNSGISFTFVTDVHIPRNNMLTPNIIKQIKKYADVNYHINGGDFLDIDTNSRQTAIDRLFYWKHAMNGIEEIAIRGNHDDNNFNGTNAANALTIGDFYAIFDRPIETAIDTNAKTYFAVDNISQKTRIILLDNNLTGNDRNIMYEWMKSKLTELSSEWTILIIQHYIWASTTESISAQGQLTINAINSVYTNINAEFIGILAGHTHVDNNAIEPTNGYLLIARDTNMIKDGTGTESLAFDYVTINKIAKTINFTKIGRGNNLSLSY